ncbi:MAG TPA: glycoside hydrolase family 47 protein, partial [Thermoanaerobaculia bacterium]|nr:glycoside hydrolase family 47 protein [Thermoanaerobaculia bacterium]
RQFPSRRRRDRRGAWEGYMRYASGHDELRPVSRAPKDWYGETLFMTPLDALDTMLLMGLREEAERTGAFRAKNLSFDKDISVKNFEITIRLLGGLLSAYRMTGDQRLLALAEDLGNRLLPVFESPTGMRCMYMYVNLKTGKTSGTRSRGDRDVDSGVRHTLPAHASGRLLRQSQEGSRPALQSPSEDGSGRGRDGRRDRRWTSPVSHACGPGACVPFTVLSPSRRFPRSSAR